MFSRYSSIKGPNDICRSPDCTFRTCSSAREETSLNLGSLFRQAFSSPWQLPNLTAGTSLSPATMTAGMPGTNHLLTAGSAPFQMKTAGVTSSRKTTGGTAPRTATAFDPGARFEHFGAAGPLLAKIPSVPEWRNPPVAVPYPLPNEELGSRAKVK